jgi:hypothetical protein
MQCSTGGLIALAGSVLSGSGIIATGARGHTTPSEFDFFAIFGGGVLILIGLTWAFSELIRGPRQR